MADTKAYPYNPVSVQQAHQGQESDQAKPRPLAKHSFVFDPRSEDPHTIGYAPGFLDMHGNVLVAPRDVVAEHPQCERVFQAGDVVHLTEQDSQLLRWMEAHRMFRRARHSDIAGD
jgi:hypothetical protein